MSLTNLINVTADWVLEKVLGKAIAKLRSQHGEGSP